MTKSILLLAAGLLFTTACSQNNQPGQGDAKLSGLGIVGGTLVNEDRDGFAKTVVALYDVSSGALCTGSIISQNMVLTAAHCIPSNANNLFLIFGADVRSSARQIRRANAAVVHPLWSSRHNEIKNTGDIAMVRFDGGLPAGFHAAQVLSDARVLTVGKPVLLAGYGITNASTQAGAGVLRKVAVTIEDPQFSVTEVSLKQNSRGACHGDSGGPAYVVVNGQPLLFGVTSRGNNDPFDSCLVGSVYTSIPAQMSFVVAATSALNPK